MRPNYRELSHTASIAADMGTGGNGEEAGTIAGARAMGATIAFLRRRSGVSQQTLAARSHTHHNYIGTLERGAIRNPGLVTVGRLARGLDVSVGVLAASFVVADPMPSAPGLGPGTQTPHEHACDGPREMGSAIRILRRRAELTQAQLADAAGLHRGHLASIEAGEKRNPGMRTIARIASGIRPPSGELRDVVADLARIFAGELTVPQLRERVPEASGPPAGLDVPLEATGT